MEKEQESKAIFLPAELYRRIEERVKATSFGSVEEYVRFVLEEVLKEGEEEKAFSKEEEEEIKKRLRALGYLD
ncbi:CopG family transcriptional regulator [Dehalococcoidia bacterium]|nr:CopG family transcriptional regulator [Dehalococcoidia bacterium]